MVAAAIVSVATAVGVVASAIAAAAAFRLILYQSSPAFSLAQARS